MMKFDIDQQQVINIQKGRHACVATAGCGKTEILTERVSQAIQMGVKTEQMLCITFTNRAARSMQHRIEHRLEGQAAQVFIGNIHAYAIALLTNNRVLPATHSLADEQITDMLWKRSVDSGFSELLGLEDDQIAKRLSAFTTNFSMIGLNGSAVDHVRRSHIEAMKNLQQTPYNKPNLKGLAGFLTTTLDDRLPILDPLIAHAKERILVVDRFVPSSEMPIYAALIRMIDALYQEEKSLLAIYDYNDLLIMALSALHTGKLKKMVGYQWCQVDEVQDIAPIQWCILNAAMASDAHLLMLGDTGQSIYRFLGASIETTQQQLGNSIHYLRKNYRSSSNLVAMANAYRNKVFGETVVESEAVLPAKNLAAVLCHRESQNDCNQHLVEYTGKVLDELTQVNAAFLLPSNSAVENFCGLLKSRGIEYFQVSQNDIFTREEGKDFLAFLSVLHQPENRAAWARLFWRFGDPSRITRTDRDGYSPMLFAAKFVADLEHQGARIFDFLGGVDPDQHYLQRFIDDVKHGQVTYYDTETTGLHYDDAIVQLAGVRVENQNIIDEINLYCQTDRDVTESSAIHGITRNVLNEKGGLIDQQLAAFLRFTKGSALIAHNLPFDDKMMRHHISSAFGEDSLEWKQYDQMPKYCTLDIARRLFPGLAQHKLGFLIDHFELTGVNSHNALDDVKAGTALMNHLVGEAEKRLTQIRESIAPYVDALSRFDDRFHPVYQKALSWLQRGDIISLTDLLNLYFEHCNQLTAHQPDQHVVDELMRKMGRHATKNFDPDVAREYINRVVPFYHTANEADLITEDDRVVVSTIHKSKGLEFDLVILPNMVEGLMPFFIINQQTKHSDTLIKGEGEALMREQERLFYVALTRAKRQVLIGTYDSDHTHYEKKATRFLAPIIKHFSKI